MLWAGLLKVKRRTERRVEHGVPTTNIETRSLGDEDNLTSEQVKKLVDNNPELSTDERRKIEGNLHVIIWANSRRANVSLDTTGQLRKRVLERNEPGRTWPAASTSARCS